MGRFFWQQTSILSSARFLFFAVVIAYFIPARGQVQQDLPTVDFVLGRVWANMEMAPFRLEGIIRTPSARHPVTLITGPRDMVYLMGGAEWDVRVQFSSDTARVFLRRNEKSEWKELAREAWDNSLLSSDITPRDLALDFLTWPDVRIIRLGNAKTLPAFIMEANSPDKKSLIRRVRYWISRDHFVVVQAEAYNENGHIVKRFDVNGVQRFGDFWTIKELRVATMIPGRNISSSRTFIEIARGIPIVD